MPIISGRLPDARRATLASAMAEGGQKRAAAVLVGVTAVLTVFLLPFADLRWTGLPGFVLINQTAMIVAYGLATWVLFAQFRRGRSVPLLLAAAGMLYTTAIVTLQLASFPGVIANGRLLGAGPATTTWLWTFWHIGPPLVGLAYASARSRPQPPVAPERTRRTSALAAIVALGLAGASAAVATLGLPWLPHQVTGDDYTALTTSGIGPAVQVLTLAALVAVWRATRTGRTVLELWLAAGLALLVLDNFLTMAGGTRASLGWYVGRVEALVSAFVILWAYLHEVDALRAHAEAATEEVARTEAALRQAQKMEAVGRLTGGIAHDFNNLLMVVSSGLDMIRRRPADVARVTKIAETGLEAVERGTRLTRQLLTFARRSDLRPETVNLNALLLGFEPLLRRAVTETVRLDLDLHPGLQPARLDGGEFEAAVLNIVVNARDALPPGGGRIAVATRNAQISPSAPPPPSGSGVIRSEVLPPAATPSSRCPTPAPAWMRVRSRVPSSLSSPPKSLAKAQASASRRSGALRVRPAVPSKLPRRRAAARPSRYGCPGSPPRLPRCPPLPRRPARPPRCFGMLMQGRSFSLSRTSRLCSPRRWRR